MLESNRNFYTKNVEQYEIITDIANQSDVSTFLSLIHSNSYIGAANILDAGCGDGFYLRQLRNHTRGQVYGVDVSREMLTQAKEKMATELPPITFEKVDLVEDSICETLKVDEGFFDIVISSWVLCHSKTVSELTRMISNIAKSLKIGGKFYGITTNPGLTPKDFSKFLKYCFTYVIDDPTKEKLEDEDRLLFTVFDPKTNNKVFELPDHYYKKETLERVFKEAGFEVTKMGTLAELSTDPSEFAEKNNTLFFEVTKIGQGKNLYNGDAAKDYYEAMIDVLPNPIREDWLELVQEIPNLSTANVLDAGCGNGRFTAALRTMTSGEVFGVDISDEMLKLTNNQQVHQEQINFRKIDITTDICKGLGVDYGHFDIVNASWVLQHSRNEEVLSQIAINISNCLKKEGVLVAMVLDTEITPEKIQKIMSYGLHYERKDPNQPLINGESIHTNFSDKDGKLVWGTQDYYYNKDTYEKAFLKAGFSKVEFFPFRIPKVPAADKFTNEIADGTLIKATK